MKVKKSRLEALRLIISSMELGSQTDVLKELKKRGYKLTQATLSRDLRQLKAARAASHDGKYVYVLPNETTYKRVSTPLSAGKFLQQEGCLSFSMSGQLAVLKTRKGYASALASDIDSAHIDGILGTIAGYDTIFIATREGMSKEEIRGKFALIIPDIIHEV